MGTVTISGSNFTIYGTQANADIYHAPALDSAALAYIAGDATKRAKGLVNASRLLDRVPWVGLPAGTPVIDSVLQWPRSGVTDADGVAVSSSDIPDKIIKACFVLAAMIIEDPTVLTQEESGSNTKRVKAGSVEVEFWGSTLGISGRFAVQVQELVGEFMRGMTGGGLSGSVSYGTDGTEESKFVDDSTFGITRWV